jgi:branched-subunit amino acid aminotransferase/4-amino-4-deoxychorismate lyase
MINLSIFSLNSQILDISEAKADLSQIEFSYGFGVYETMKVRNGKLFFVKEHSQRLLFSAQQIFLQHNFSQQEIINQIQNLVFELKKINTENFSCNLKILLIGHPDPEKVKLYIIPLNPLFVDRKKYKQGGEVMTFRYSRWMPCAKSLNMLPSYVYFSKAKKLGFYDCLFLEPDGEITEGSRTNFFAIQDKTIFSSSKDKILDGITRQTVLKVAVKNGYKYEEKKINIQDFENQVYQNCFITSTSTKILPIKTIYLNHLDNNLEIENREEIRKIELANASQELKQLMKLYDQFLDEIGDF